MKKRVKFLFPLFCLILLSCAQESSLKVYRVRRVEKPVSIDADWEKPVWKTISSLELKHFMGDRPDHFPKTRAKVAYNDSAVYVIFRVEDRFVRAVADTFQGRVYDDSCVEFFFTPTEDITDGYFNLETNCGGTQLFWHQTKPWADIRRITSEEYAHVKVAASLPRRVDPEMAEPVIWTVEYRLPWSLLKTYGPVNPPASGVKWRANFYKCANQTSHPHFLTWSHVEFDRPNFHLPRFFGWLVFE